jgi:lipopolysaccharide/colanic/teichoic acid biosynthesis glycosyltransferase
MMSSTLLRPGISLVTDIGIEVNPWNRSRAKRSFDLLLALILLILSSPLMLAVALVVRVASKGPIFYRQWRVGREGREFQLLKFRTMTHAPEQQGPSVTRAKDPRITAAGRLLRKWKLDELPQLFNVVRGDMSFVGPRPDVSRYLESLDDAQKQVLHLRPGITGSATLRYRNEEQLLAQVPAGQLESFYCTQVLPEKVRLDLDYARNAGFISDVAILFRTFRAILN